MAVDVNAPEPVPNNLSVEPVGVILVTVKNACVVPNATALTWLGVDANAYVITREPVVSVDPDVIPYANVNRFRLVY
jgi:hypothetical protein